MNTGLNVLPISQILSCSDGIAAAATFRRCSVLREMVCAYASVASFLAFAGCLGELEVQPSGFPISDLRPWWVGQPGSHLRISGQQFLVFVILDVV